MPHPAVASPMVKPFGFHAVRAPMAALAALAAGMASPAEALTMDVFLIATQSAPAATSSTPFSVATTVAYRLTDLNGNKKAKTATLVDDFTFDVGAALSYNSDYANFDPSDPGIVDEGEVGAGSAALIQAEISLWDDVGIAGGGPETHLDVGRNTDIVFNPVPGGFQDLIIAESGALTPFMLSLCPDVACGTGELIFSGFATVLEPFLVGLPEFALEESADETEMDQAFLFRFSDPVFDYVRVSERGNRSFYTGERLEIDFIGVGAAAPVPVPGAAPLLAGGLACLVWFRRRGRRPA